MNTKLPDISKPIEHILLELKSVVAKHFGERLKYFVLYGSYARGDFHKNSDIDIMVVLDKIESEMQEIDTLSVLKTDILLESDIYISTNPVSEEKFEKSNFTFYRNARKDGILI